MHCKLGFFVGLLCSISGTFVTAAPLAERQTTPVFAGYLISTFSDADPSVQFYLSNGNDATSFSKANGGKPVLRSNVGDKAVRDVYLTSNGDRSKWYIIATDLNINANGFSWDKATRHGSRSLVVWSSTNLVNWQGPTLVEAEGPAAGMVWAPSAVWNSARSEFDVFWASRFYNQADTQHTGTASNDVIRHATTKDFTSFSSPSNYIAPSYPVIDQEFLYLGQPGHYARFVKDETKNQVYQEKTTTGIFGSWTRIGGFTTTTAPVEGPASFRDNLNPSKYHLLLDNYSEYVPYETDDIGSGVWKAVQYPNFPRGLKHGSVTPLTQREYDTVKAAYPA